MYLHKLEGENTSWLYFHFPSLFLSLLFFLLSITSYIFFFSFLFFVFLFFSLDQHSHLHSGLGRESSFDHSRHRIVIDGQNLFNHQKSTEKKKQQQTLRYKMRTSHFQENKIISKKKKNNHTQPNGRDSI